MKLTFKPKLFCAALFAAMLFTVIGASAEELDLKYENSKALVDILLGETAFNKAADSAVSRYEFVKETTQLLKIPSTDRQLQFEDISQNDTNFGCFAAAADAGLISEAKEFRPNDSISFNEAAKIAVIAIGMEEYAEAEGGYPSGYFAVAEKTGLISKVGADMTVRDCYVLFANLLCTTQYSMLKEYSGGVGRVPSYNQSGKSVMNFVYKLYAYEGIVTKTRYSSLYGTDVNMKSDDFGVDGMDFAYSEQSGEELGKKCLVLYEDDDERTIKHCITTDNNELTLSARDIFDISDSVLQYTADDRDKKIHIGKAIPVIYNGRYTKKPLDSFTDINGYITLIDNSRDDVYDVAFVSDYKYLKIESIDVASLRFSDYKNNYDFDLYNFDGRCSLLDFNGNETGFEMLSVDDVCAVKCSEDMLVIEIRTLERGEIEKIETVNYDKGTIGFGGKEYWISEYFKANCSEQLRSGNSGTAYFGMTDDIVYMNGSTDYAYGLLVRVIKGSDDDKDAILLRIFTESGQMKIFKIRNKPIVDGTTLKNINDMDKYSTSAGSLIRFKTDKNYEVSHIDFSEHGTVYGEKRSDDNCLKEYTFADAEKLGNFYYRSVSKSCQPYFSLENAVVFMIPQDTSEYDDYAVGTYSALGSKKTLKTSNVRVYDMDEYMRAGAVVISNYDNKTVQAADSTYIIDKIVDGIDEDDTLGRWIQCWTAGKFYQLFLPYDVTAQNSLGTDICTGDIVRLATDGGSKIVRIEVDYDVSDGTVRRTTPTDSNVHYGENGVRQDYDMMYNDGSAYSFKGSYITLSRASDGNGGYLYNSENLRQYLLTTSNVVKYNFHTKSLTPIKLSGIQTYLSDYDNADYIVLKQNAYNTTMAVVYEKE